MANCVPVTYVQVGGFHSLPPRIHGFLRSGSNHTETEGEGTDWTRRFGAGTSHSVEHITVPQRVPVEEIAHDHGSGKPPVCTKTHKNAMGSRVILGFFG